MTRFHWQAVTSGISNLRSEISNLCSELFASFALQTVRIRAGCANFRSMIPRAVFPATGRVPNHGPCSQPWAVFPTMGRVSSHGPGAHATFWQRPKAAPRPSGLCVQRCLLLHKETPGAMGGLSALAGTGCHPSSQTHFSRSPWCDRIRDHSPIGQPCALRVMDTPGFACSHVCERAHPRASLPYPDQSQNRRPFGVRRFIAAF